MQVQTQAGQCAGGVSLRSEVDIYGELACGGNLVGYFCQEAPGEHWGAVVVHGGEASFVGSVFLEGETAELGCHGVETVALPFFAHGCRVVVCWCAPEVEGEQWVVWCFALLEDRPSSIYPFDECSSGSREVEVEVAADESVVQLSFAGSDCTGHDGPLDTVAVAVVFGRQTSLAPVDGVSAFCPWCCDAKTEVHGQPHLCSIRSVDVEDLCGQVDLCFGTWLDMRKLNWSRQYTVRSITC